MTYSERLIVACLICLGFTLATPSNGLSQEVIDEAAQLLQDEFPLSTDDILGDLADDEELAGTEEKSEISGLEFLSSGEAPDSIEQLKAMQQHVAALYDRVEPAVVNIQSNSGQGSGVVISSDGYVLTAAHVISIPNRSAIVTFPDGRRARAQTLGLFRGVDAGLLKIYQVLPTPKKKDEESSGDKDEDEKEEDEKEEDEKTKTRRKKTRRKKTATLTKMKLMTRKTATKTTAIQKNRNQNPTMTTRKTSHKQGPEGILLLSRRICRHSNTSISVIRQN